MYWPLLEHQRLAKPNLSSEIFLCQQERTGNAQPPLKTGGRPQTNGGVLGEARLRLGEAQPPLWMFTGTHMFLLSHGETPLLPIRLQKSPSSVTEKTRALPAITNGITLVVSRFGSRPSANRQKNCGLAACSGRHGMHGRSNLVCHQRVQGPFEIGRAHV